MYIFGRNSLNTRMLMCPVQCLRDAALRYRTISRALSRCSRFHNRLTRALRCHWTAAVRALQVPLTRVRAASRCPPPGAPALCAGLHRNEPTCYRPPMKQQRPSGECRAWQEPVMRCVTSRRACATATASCGGHALLWCRLPLVCTCMIKQRLSLRRGVTGHLTRVQAVDHSQGPFEFSSFYFTCFPARYKFRGLLTLRRRRPLLFPFNNSLCATPASLPALSRQSLASRPCGCVSSASPGPEPSRRSLWRPQRLAAFQGLGREHRKLPGVLHKLPGYAVPGMYCVDFAPVRLLCGPSGCQLLGNLCTWRPHFWSKVAAMCTALPLLLSIWVCRATATHTCRAGSGASLNNNCCLIRWLS